MNNSDMPAMPAGAIGKRRINQNDPGSNFETMSYSEPVHRGLTKREHFAAMAMQGILANPSGHQETVMLEIVAFASASFADALLAELDRTK